MANSTAIIVGRKAPAKYCPFVKTYMVSVGSEGSAVEVVPDTVTAEDVADAVSVACVGTSVTVPTSAQYGGAGSQKGQSVAGLNNSRIISSVAVIPWALNRGGQISNMYSINRSMFTL